MSLQTTLCYLEDGDRYLLLHRTKKKTTRITTSGSALAGNSRTAKAPRTAFCAKFARKPG